MASSRISDILSSIARLEEPIRVSGLPFPAMALTLARWIASSAVPVVAIAPTEEAATSLAGNLETLARAVLGHPFEVRVLPTWDQSPYRAIAPSIRTRLERIATLSRVASLSPVSIGGTDAASMGVGGEGPVPMVL